MTLLRVKSQVRSRILKISAFALLGATIACMTACSNNSNNANASSTPTATSTATPTPSPSVSPSESPAATDGGTSSSNPYEVAGVTDAAAFEQMFLNLQKAVAADDKEAASQYVLYPLRVNGGKEPVTIEDKDDFVSKYDLIFTDKVKQALAAQKTGDLFVNYQGAMVGNGEIWLGVQGDTDQQYGMISVNLNTES